MPQLPSSFWINTRGPGESSGVLTWVTPSALFRLGATSRSLRSALSTPAARLHCRFNLQLKAEDWVYIDDLVSGGYNGRYAQVVGPLGSSDSKVPRYACAIYGVPGKKVQTHGILAHQQMRRTISLPLRSAHQQMRRTVSLPLRSLVKVQATTSAVRLYAYGERHPADAVKMEIDGLTSGEDEHFAATVQIPAGLLGCITQAQKFTSMRNTGMPLVLQDVEMLNDGDCECPLANVLNLTLHFEILKATITDFTKMHGLDWSGYYGPHLVFRADGANFCVHDLHFFFRFAMSVGGVFVKAARRQESAETVMPMLFDEFEAKFKHHHVEEDSALSAEPPCRIDEQVAAVAADVKWAERIEERIHADVAATPGSTSHLLSPDAGQVAGSGVPPTERINLLRIGSPPRAGDSLDSFRRSLLVGKQLKVCRDALEEAGLDFVLPQQALMVVTPEHYAAARHALNGIELHPFHLIVAEQFDYLIEEVLADLPYKRRPRIKQGAAGRQELCVLPGSPPMETDEDESADEGEGASRETVVENSCAQHPEIIVQRTFLCEAPKLKSPADVSCQSTTDVFIDQAPSGSHYGYKRGVNPRRYA